MNLPSHYRIEVSTELYWFYLSSTNSPPKDELNVKARKSYTPTPRVNIPCDLNVVGKIPDGTLHQNCWMVLYHHCLWIIIQHHKNTGSRRWIGKTLMENGREGPSSYYSTDTASKYQTRWTGLLTWSVMGTARATHNIKCQIQLH